MSFKIGTKVHYSPYTGCTEFEKQNGVVKSHTDDLTDVFVVFNCANDWKNYQNYTGQKTKISQLEFGWV